VAVGDIMEPTELSPPVEYTQYYAHTPTCTLTLCAIGLFVVPR